MLILVPICSVISLPSFFFRSREMCATHSRTVLSDVITCTAIALVSIYCVFDELRVSTAKEIVRRTFSVASTARGTYLKLRRIACRAFGRVATAFQSIDLTVEKGGWVGSGGESEREGYR